MSFLKSSVLIFSMVALAVPALALTQSERALVEKAKAHLQQARKDFNQATTEAILADQRADAADQRAKDAEDHAAETDGRLSKLKKEIDDAHENEKKLAAENDKMRPVYEKCNRWWGIGAIIWGFGRLCRNILITGVVLAVLAGALWGLSFAFPIIGVGLKITGAFLKSLLSRISALIARLRKKKDPP